MYISQPASVLVVSWIMSSKKSVYCIIVDKKRTIRIKQTRAYLEHQTTAKRLALIFRLFKAKCFRCDRESEWLGRTDAIITLLFILS